MEVLQAEFARRDVDKTGSVTAHDFRQALRQFGISEGLGPLVARFSKYGQVDYVSFLGIFSGVTTDPAEFIRQLKVQKETRPHTSEVFKLLVKNSLRNELDRSSGALQKSQYFSSMLTAEAFANHLHHMLPELPGWLTKEALTHARNGNSYSFQQLFSSLGLMTPQVPTQAQPQPSRSVCFDQKLATSVASAGSPASVWWQILSTHHQIENNGIALKHVAAVLARMCSKPLSYVQLHEIFCKDSITYGDFISACNC